LCGFNRLRNIAAGFPAFVGMTVQAFLDLTALPLASPEKGGSFTHYYHDNYHDNNVAKSLCLFLQKKLQASVIGV